MKTTLLALVLAAASATSALAYTAPVNLDGIPTAASIASPDGAPDQRFDRGRW